jgi:hypothetical protein
MFKVNHGKGLSVWGKRFNKLIFKWRYLVEQEFRTLKRRFGMARTWAQSIYKLNSP